MANLVFISHSHSDQNVASALIDLLLSALELEEKEVRCTSVPGHQLPFGKTISQQLKDDINTSTAIIALLSRESIRSPWVPFELGASWAFGKIIVPVLGSGVTGDQLPGPLAEYPYIQVDSPDAFSRVTDAITQIAETLDIKERTGGKRQEKLTSFVNAFRVLHPPAASVRLSETNIPDVGEVLEQRDGYVKWKPPHKIGDVYIVIRKKKEQVVGVYAKWGEWDRIEKANLNDYDGLVLKLRHSDPGSYPLIIETEGDIKGEPSQDGCPGEWNDGRYLKVAW